MFISSLRGLNRMSEQNQSEIIIYQTEDGLTRVNVTFSDETVWLSQQQIAELFQKSRTTIVEHIHNIYKEGELEEASTCRNYRQVQTEGSREVSRTIPLKSRIRFTTQCPGKRLLR